MDDFLVKPLSPEALRTALARWTGHGWTGRADPRQGRLLEDSVLASAGLAFTEPA